MKNSKTEKKNPFLWLAPLILSLVSAALIPLAMFVLFLPHWAAILACVLVLASLVIMWIKLKRKLPAKIFISLFSIIAIAGTVLGSLCNPYWNGILFRNDSSLYTCKAYDYELTYAQAKADLDFAYNYLKKLHPKFYKNTPKEIEERYEKAAAELKDAEKITVNYLAGEIQKMFFMLGDAHTALYLNHPNARYMKYIDRRKSAGDSLVGINGQSLERLLDIGSPCCTRVSYEVPSWGVIQLKSYIGNLEGLDYLGIPVEDGITYNYETKEGEKVDVFVTESDFLTYDEYVKFNASLGTDDSEGSTEETSFVSYTIDKEDSAAVLTLTECNYNAEYINTLNEMFREIKAQNIKNLAVDLRDNGGGNSLAANELFKYLNIEEFKEGALEHRLGWFMFGVPNHYIWNEKYSDLTFYGNLYLLTSNYSFSSAMIFAEYVKDNNLGTIIGEAPGNDPNSYGEISVFKLPNSGAAIQISTKAFYRIDNKTGLILPDIPCDKDDALDCFYKEIL